MLRMLQVGARGQGTRAALGAGVTDRVDLLKDVVAVGDVPHRAEAVAICADRKSWSEWVDCAFDHGGGADNWFCSAKVIVSLRKCALQMGLWRGPRWMSLPARPHANG